MKIRLAQDADGPRIGELARASGFGVDGTRRALDLT